MLTLPSMPVAKNTTHTITLTKATMFALAPVAADSYFSVQANVKNAIIEYNSDPGNQREILTFDLSQASPTASFNVSDKARTTFLLERLILEDYDGGTLILSRAALPSGLDITTA